MLAARREVLKDQDRRLLEMLAWMTAHLINISGHSVKVPITTDELLHGPKLRETKKPWKG